MVHIDPSKLKHNPEAIRNCFSVKNNMTIATKNIRIMFLDIFLRKNLAEISDYVTLVGLYAIIDDDDNYGVSIAPCMQKLLVDNIDDSTCTDGQLYKMLYINKGSVIMDNNNIVIDDGQLYYLCDVIFVGGKVPWYIDYNKLSKIFNETPKYNKVSVGKDRIVFEILSSVIARGKDKSVYYRNSPEFNKLKPQWVDIKNIYYSLPSTSSKLIGGYYGAAVGVAVLNPEKTVSTIETVLMGKVKDTPLEQVTKPLSGYEAIKGLGYKLDVGKPATDENIKSMENRLSIKIGKEFKEYLKEFGTLEVNHLEFYGYTDNSSSLPNAVHATLYHRLSVSGFSNELIVFYERGDGTYYGVNSKDEVFECNYNRCNKLSLTFKQFIIDKINKLKG